jgi:hypothetical protein
VTYLLKKLLLDLFLAATAPLVFAFVPREWNRLPRWLRYYEDAHYGINGDDQWINPALPDHPPNDAAARAWRWRVRWSWRNANTWDAEAGLDTRTVVRVEWDGDIGIRNKPAPGRSGTCRIRAWDNQGRQWDCTYTVRQWGSSGRCLRYYRGYKLMDLAQHAARTSGDLSPKLMDELGLRRVLNRVWAWNPLMGFARE